MSIGSENTFDSKSGTPEYLNNQLLRAAKGEPLMGFGGYESLAEIEARRAKLAEERAKEAEETSRWFRESVQLNIDFPE